MESMRKPRRVALFVGVDEYDDASGITRLRYAVNDAKALYKEILEKANFDPDSAILVNPRSEDVFKKAMALRRGLGPDDVFLFYFAGHGVTVDSTHNLLCSNSAYDESSGIINTLTLESVIGRQQICHRAVILDACRSSLDASTRSGPGDDYPGMRDITLKSLETLVGNGSSTGTSLSILCSCDQGKKAGEVVALEHGLFTQALLDVIKDRDPLESMLFDSRFAEKIQLRMCYYAKSYGKQGDQLPWFQTNNQAEAPELLKRDVNVGNLIEKLKDLENERLIQYEVRSGCEDMLHGKGSPSAQDAIIHVCMNLGKVGGRSDMGLNNDHKCAAVILNALCDNSVSKLQGRISELENQMREREGATQGRTSSCAQPADASAPESAAPSRQLTGEERRRLRAVADGVRPEWRRKAAMAKACEALKTATTEAEAVKAIRAADDAVRDEFVRENDSSGITKRAFSRLDALFTSQEWNSLKNYLRDNVPYESQCQCEMDRVLSRLFRLSNTCCRLLTN